MNRSDCPISCALDIIGDKWTLLIIRDALYKKFTTYGEFQSSSEKISSNILAARLAKMVDQGIFEKVKDDHNKLIIHYILTEKGRDLGDVVIAVGKWGNTHVDDTLDLIEKIKAAESGNTV